MAALGEWFYLGFVGMQLAVVLLAVPAATAGSICLDRARGTLTHMLVTDLSSAEIVLGKLAARLVPVLGLLACTLPLLEILALVGGLDPNALLGAFVVAVGIAVLGSSLALFFSLWVGKTHEAILGTYAVWGVWLLWAPISSIVRLLFPKAMFLPPPLSADPFWLVFAPYRCRVWWRGKTTFCSLRLHWRSRQCWWRWPFSGCAIVTRDSLKRRPSRTWLERLVERFGRGRRLPRPSLDWNPVFWREWHRSKPSRWARAIVALYFALATTFSLMMVALRANMAAPWVNGVQVSVGLLILSVTAAVSLAEERARGSLDLLMTTMLSTRQIVVGKWLGTYRAVPLFAILPAVVSFGLAYDQPERWSDVLVLIVYIFCSGAAITSLGLAMATWLPRVSSAVAATVTIYLAITVGWLFVVLILESGGEGLLMVSPFAWTLLVTFRTTGGGPRFDLVAPWAILWTFVMAIDAVALLIATLAVFDRKLGRGESARSRLMNGIFTCDERAFRIVFLGTAAVATVAAMSGGAQSDFAFVVNGSQVLIGLLLAAIAATNSTARQFERDAMAPPVLLGLAPLKNVLANWLGPCRLVALMALLATLVVVALEAQCRALDANLARSRVHHVRRCSAWCAFGVAMGMRFTCRTALLLLAAAYAVVMIVAPIAAMPFRDSGQSQMLMAASPFVEVSMLTMRMSPGDPPGFEVLGGALAATALHAAAIAILLTVAVFALERRVARNATTAV